MSFVRWEFSLYQAFDRFVLVLVIFLVLAFALSCRIDGLTDRENENENENEEGNDRPGFVLFSGIDPG